MGMSKSKKSAEKKELPWLMESGIYDLEITYVKLLDDYSGYSIGFTTLTENEEDKRIFFQKFRLTDGYADVAKWRYLYGCLLMATQTRPSDNAEDLRGKRFKAKIEVKDVQGYANPFCNFKKVRRYEEC